MMSLAIFDNSKPRVVSSVKMMNLAVFDSSMQIIDVKKKYLMVQNITLWSIMRNQQIFELNPLGLHSTTCYSYFMILVEVSTNHILAENTYFTNHRV